jgi:hypothetical protein
MVEYLDGGVFRSVKSVGMRAESAEQLLAESEANDSVIVIFGRFLQSSLLTRTQPKWHCVR